MDFTQLNTYQACPKRYQLRFLQGLRKIVEDKREIPRDFGQAIHVGLAVYYSGGDLDSAAKAFLSQFPTGLNPGETTRTPENGLRCLRDYLRFAAHNDKDWKILEVEQPGSFRWDGFETDWEVKPDLIIETPSGIYGVNHKTTGKPLNESYWRPYGLDGWITGCTAYIAHKYAQCGGVIINAIRLAYREKPELFDLSKEEEARQYANVEKKFSKYYGKEMLYAWGFSCQFQRQVFNRTLRQVEDWKRDTEDWLKVLNRSVATGEFPKNTTQCQWCEFQEHCESTGDEQVEAVLYEKYNPYEYLHHGTEMSRAEPSTEEVKANG